MSMVATDCPLVLVENSGRGSFIRTFISEPSMIRTLCNSGKIAGPSSGGHSSPEHIAAVEGIISDLSSLVEGLKRNWREEQAMERNLEEARNYLRPDVGKP